MRLPKTISLKVGRKLAHKTKDEIMTDVLRIFASLDVKAVHVAYEVVRVTFASPEHFWAAKSFSGKHLFGLWFLSNQNIFNGTRLVDVALSEVLPRFLMVDGYLCRLWYVVNPLFAIFVPFSDTDPQTALTRTSAESVGKPGTLLRTVPLTGQRETLS